MIGSWRFGLDQMLEGDPVALRQQQLVGVVAVLELVDQKSLFDFGGQFCVIGLAGAVTQDG